MKLETAVSIHFLGNEAKQWCWEEDASETVSFLDGEGYQQLVEKYVYVYTAIPIMLHR